MKMYYITRYEHNPLRQTLYYAGGGQWTVENHDRLSLRLYNSENYCKAVIASLTECDWHCIELRG